MVKSTCRRLCGAVAVADLDTAAADNAGGRGELIIRSKVAQRLAERAAAGCTDVVPHAAGLGKITGRTSPNARVVVSGRRCRALVEVAVAWPAPVARAARRVQEDVAAALTDYAGLHVDRVDVIVTHVLSVEDRTSRSIQ